MKKVYKTLASSAVIQVSTPNGVRQVYFRNGFVGRGSLRGGVFETENEELQKGIESHKRFRTGFDDEIWTDDHAESEQPVENQETEAKPKKAAAKKSSKKSAKA